MSKIVPFVEELWNNTISPYKNWHNKIKWFSIFIKPNKCQKNRKGTEMGKTYLCLPAGWHCAAGLAQRPSRPAQLAGRASRPLPRARRTGARARRAQPRARPPPAFLSLPSSPGCPARRHGPPCTSLALSRAHSLFPSLSLAHGQTPPSPPLAAAAVAAVAADRRRTLPPSPPIAAAPPEPPPFRSDSAAVRFFFGFR